MMAEAETLTALHDQVAALRDKVESAEATVRGWDARLQHEGIGGTLVLRTEVKKMARELAEALEKNRLKPPPAPWWCVDQAEGTAMLAELRSWVDGFLRRHYPGYLAALRPCWVNHPEAVWELSTLQAEWIRIYADEQNRELKGALAWHDRWLPGVLARLKMSISCDESGCRAVRHS